jgi:hypothetical protein
MKPKTSGQEGEPVYNNYEPCDECNGHMEQGILVVQVTETKNKNPPIVDGLYPTGLWVVLEEENLKNVLTDYPAIDNILNTKTMYINVNDWDDMFKM